MNYLSYISTFFVLFILGCNSNQHLFENEVQLVDRVIFSNKKVYSTHSEVDLRYPTNGTSLAGTLYLPRGSGPHPVMIFQFGSNDWQRSNTPVGTYWMDRGLAIFIFDKRGLGESGGVCCDDNIPLYADDLLASASALIQYPDVDSLRIGLFGFSQGGWVVAEAASRNHNFAFTIIGSGAAVSTGEEALYSVLTGDESCKRSEMSNNEIDSIMDKATPSGYDPRNALAIMPQPSYWFFGGLDTSNPIRQSIKVLSQIKVVLGKDWTIRLYPDGNHEFVKNGGPCESSGEIINTADDITTWLKTIVGIDSM